MIQAIPVSGNTGHEDIPTDLAVENVSDGLHLRSGRSPLPVVREIEDSIEPSGTNRRTNARRIIPIRYEVANAPAERVGFLAMENSDLMPGMQQISDKHFPDELRTTDDEYSLCCILNRNAILPVLRM
jgi:hypothetical protein